MSLFIRTGSRISSYDENLRSLASKSMSGDIVCVDNDVVYIRNGDFILSYDKNLKRLASKQI